MELFNENGCLTDEGLQALVNGQLDELGPRKLPWSTPIKVWVR